MVRPGLEDVYMAIATIWSARSTCSQRAAVGAVLVSPDGRIVASGYNGSPAGEPHCDEVGCQLDDNGHCTRAIHAEENVIIQCASHGARCAGCNLFITHSPCLRCAGKIIQSGIMTVYYASEYKDFGLAARRLAEANVGIRRTTSSALYNVISSLMEKYNGQ